MGVSATSGTNSGAGAEVQLRARVQLRVRGLLQRERWGSRYRRSARQLPPPHALRPEPSRRRRAPAPVALEHREPPTVTAALLPRPVQMKREPRALRRRGPLRPRRLEPEGQVQELPALHPQVPVRRPGSTRARAAAVQVQVQVQVQVRPAVRTIPPRGWVMLPAELLLR